jgi:hypothetical protein
MTLSNSQLAAAFREGRPVQLPYFGGNEVELLFEDEVELLHSADTIRNFLALGPADRAADTRHAWAYFNDFTNDVGFEWIDEGMVTLPQGSRDIWNFVAPNSITVQESWDIRNRNATRRFLVLEGNCGWEVEHGIAMSWREGRDLVKLSPYDGHATNGHAYDDLSKDAWIYYSTNPALCTMAT